LTSQVMLLLSTP